MALRSKRKWQKLTFIDNLHYIFMLNVLKFRKPYGTINKGLPFRIGQNHRGDVEARHTGSFHSYVKPAWFNQKDNSRSGELVSPSCVGDISSFARSARKDIATWMICQWSFYLL